MTKKKALITGITGQDGSYLAEFLLDKGYEVHGLVRRNSVLFNFERINHLHDSNERKIHLHYADMTDAISITHVLEKVRPEEIYNLAAQSHVQVSFETPLYTAQTTGIGVLHLLEAIRVLKLDTKVYQAGTSELFSGDPAQAPQNELTPFRPKSPYGVAKLYASEIARTYRESYGMFIVNGILFNHESPRRGNNFVTRKITLTLRDILVGKRDKLVLGNTSAKRDWGYAPEYVEAMWMMLQQEEPNDFVIATGETHSVQEFVDEGCRLAGLNVSDILETSSKYERPNEVNYLCGDPTKAKEKLGWEPKVRFKELVKIMMKAELEGTGHSIKE